MTSTAVCRSCGRVLGPVDLVCPACHALVYKDRLEQLAALASSQESSNPAAAVQTWLQALALLPSESRQHQIIKARISNLHANRSGSMGIGDPDAIESPRPAISRSRTAISAVA